MPIIWYNGVKMKRPPLNTNNGKTQNPLNSNYAKFKRGNFDYKKRMKSREVLDELR